LNTVPLVWGLEHGAQQDIFELNYALPSECADQLATGDADIGIVPVIEIARQKTRLFPQRRHRLPRRGAQHFARLQGSDPRN